MLYNVITGYNDVTQRSNDEIVILVSSLQTLVDLDRQFVFTDRHAYLNYPNFYSDLTDLDKLDWESLQARDFRRDPEDPGKFERYQAEALVYRHLPSDSLLGVCLPFRRREDRIGRANNTWSLAANQSTV